MRRAILITALGCALIALGGCESKSGSNGANNTGTNEPGVLPPPNSQPIDGGGNNGNSGGTDTSDTDTNSEGGDAGAGGN